jgi:hypothetical protein
MKGAMERRQFRRAELELPIILRSMEQKAGMSPTVVTAYVKNISLAGVYCYVKSPCPFVSGESVISSVTVPTDQVRSFPFTRLGGKGWVVRVDELSAGRRSSDQTAEELLFGVAVAFAPGVTALASIDL